MQTTNELRKRLEADLMDRGSFMAHMGTLQTSEPSTPEILGFQHKAGSGGLGGEQIPDQLGSHSQILGPEISDVEPSLRLRELNSSPAYQCKLLTSSSAASLP